ncbi:MFS general substrate transporter [Tilletiaria anomala UBC 951]|uniref:MFS general substrate transporter n=1 Tax=Tilletiaria anomala (strain ATCC 24038 / CBS 436.72 / UBC 951) TaxID=1037660 RepID=A0A066VAX3_TILAU|nr:MFS general substrate transporter [Tilletiaria anomala UBC 951]KDN35745.1 MFS general substrate transporter [Tilletiaria anomala UBC 951]
MSSDPAHPLNCSPRCRWGITCVCALLTLSVSATALSYTLGIPSMERDLGFSNHFLSLLGLAIFVFGCGLSPLYTAPLRRIVGEKSIIVVCCVGIAKAKNIATVIALRLLLGMAGASGSTLTGGSITDIWTAAERGKPMALFATSALFGTGISHVFAGWIEQNPSLGRRWIHWTQAIYSGVLLVLLALLPETRVSVLLTRRANPIPKKTGNDCYRARGEREKGFLRVMLKVSLVRPFIFLATEPIVIAFSTWVGFCWGLLYSLLSSIQLVTALHGFTPDQTGLFFLFICLGALVGQMTNPLQEKLYLRLYRARVGALLVPIGCFVYGWTSFSSASIAGPFVGIVMTTTGIYHIYLGVLNYLSDSYLIYASSALAAQSLLHNLLGSICPLRLTYPWASSLAGFIGFLFSLIPFVLILNGPRIRARSR